jgi:hypothetical protein
MIFSFGRAKTYTIACLRSTAEAEGKGKSNNDNTSSPLERIES